MKLEMKVSRENNILTHSLLTCVLSSQPSQSWSPSFDDARLLENNLPSMAEFQSPIQVSSASIEQNFSIQENLNVAISESSSVISNSKHMAWLYEKTLQIILSISISSKLQPPSRYYFKALITWRAIFVRSALRGISIVLKPSKLVLQSSPTTG